MSVHGATESRAPGRAWYEPGLLRRIAAQRPPIRSRPQVRPPWWQRLSPPSRRWTIEGAIMVFLAAACITIGGEVSVGLPAGAPAAAPSTPSTRQQPTPTQSCMPAPIPYSGRALCP